MTCLLSLTTVKLVKAFSASQLRSELPTSSRIKINCSNCKSGLTKYSPRTIWFSNQRKTHSLYEWEFKKSTETLLWKTESKTDEAMLVPGKRRQSGPECHREVDAQRMVHMPLSAALAIYPLIKLHQLRWCCNPDDWFPSPTSTLLCIFEYS